MFDGAITPETQLLVNVRGLLEKGWCKGTLAQDANNKAVEASDAGAARWCLAGAISRTGQDCDQATVMRAVFRLKNTVFALSVPQYYCLRSFNDAQKTVEPVLELLDRAILASMAVVA
jgi:hypothetical protein